VFRVQVVVESVSVLDEEALDAVDHVAGVV
jgi:hypothetical protein